MMTKKHYDKLAAIVNLTIMRAYNYDPRLSLRFKEIGVGVANQIADMLAEDNPNFNRRMFLKACGIEWE